MQTCNRGLTMFGILQYFEEAITQMDSWCESAKVPPPNIIVQHCQTWPACLLCCNVILWRLVSAWEGPRHRRCDVSIEPRWSHWRHWRHCVDKPDTSPLVTSHSGGAGNLNILSPRSGDCPRDWKHFWINELSFNCGSLCNLPWSG